MMQSSNEQETASRSPKIPSVPDLVRNEALAAFVAVVVVCVVSSLLDAPMEGPADAGGIPAQTVKAPWIFLGIQQLLRYLPTSVAGLILPLAALLGLAAIPWLPVGRRRLVSLLFCGIVVVCTALTLWGQIR